MHIHNLICSLSACLSICNDVKFIYNLFLYLLRANVYLCVCLSATLYSLSVVKMKQFAICNAIFFGGFEGVYKGGVRGYEKGHYPSPQ